MPAIASDPTQTPAAAARKIPHPFLSGLTIDTESLAPSTMGTNNQFLPAHLLPGTCVTICSVVPWSLTSQQYPHRNLPRYHIEAAGRDPETGKDHPYRLLHLYNTASRILLVSESRDGHVFGDAPIYALGVQTDPGNLTQGYAVDLIREWAGDHPVGNHKGKLGVSIIIGERPWQPNNEPTTQELKKLRDLQRGHHYGLIQMADEAWISNDPKTKARTGSQEYRRALEFAVRDYGEKFERHPWYIQLGPDTGAAAMGSCPVCFNPFNTNAFICGSCRYNLAEYFTTRGIKFDPKEFPGVAKEIEFMKKVQAGKPS